LNVNPAEIKPVRLGRRVPLELYEARNAVQIARWTGSQQYAVETFQKATQGLDNAERLNGKADKKQVVGAAREAVQMAEDSRIIAVKKMEEERLANERQAGAERELRAESGRAAAQADAERVAREAEAARLNAQADADRLKQANDAQIAAAQTEADRLKRENDAQLAAAQSEADRLKQENDAQRAAAQADLDRATSAKAQAEAEKTELRTQVLMQFNAILQTRDSARGLSVNMSDVLFDTAKYSLRPLAREKLAKVAGIVAGHPGLSLDVEGHTDSVGGDDYNQQLSEHRGSAVRDFLVQQGMAEKSVTSRGFGKTQPVASNDTAAGRQQNRRVELVISGDISGNRLGTRRQPRCDSIWQDGGSGPLNREVLRMRKRGGGICQPAFLFLARKFSIAAKHGEQWVTCAITGSVTEIWPGWRAMVFSTSLLGRPFVSGLWNPFRLVRRSSSSSSSSEGRGGPPDSWGTAYSSPIQGLKRSPFRSLS
jgi:outer membrane protein OmpA-like peptidoglycan-associated protein